MYRNPRREETSGILDLDSLMDILSYLVGVMADAAPVPALATPADATDAPGEEFSKVIHARLDDLSGRLDQFTRAVRTEFDAFAESFREVSIRMTSGLSTSVDAVSDTVVGLGDSVRGATETLARNLAGMEEANQRLESALASSSDQVAVASDRLLAGVQSQVVAEEAVRNLAAAMGEFAARLSDIEDMQAVLGQVLKQLAGPLELRLTPVKK